MSSTKLPGVGVGDQKAFAVAEIVVLAAETEPKDTNITMRKETINATFDVFTESLLPQVSL
ncbi:MAG: hypothetical protein WDA42_03570 [Candidatus Bathyarchaeia archaeon]